MSKKRLLSSIIAMSMLAGMSDYSLDSEYHLPTRCKSKEEIAGYEHKGKTPAQLEARKQRRQKFKAKRNAKKGIYEHKIVYKKAKTK